MHMSDDVEIRTENKENNEEHSSHRTALFQIFPKSRKIRGYDRRIFIPHPFKNHGIERNESGACRNDRKGTDQAEDVQQKQVEHARQNCKKRIVRLKKTVFAVHYHTSVPLCIRAQANKLTRADTSFMCSLSHITAAR